MGYMGDEEASYEDNLVVHEEIQNEGKEAVA